jgi:lysophospholipase L1-like esterase
MLALVTTIRVSTLYDDIPALAEHWSHPQGEAGGLLYVALGDSAAQGLGASSPDTGYVGLIAQHLRDESGLPVQVRNLSKSGATVRDLIETQLAQLQSLPVQPDVVTVCIGGNDVRGFDRDRFAQDAADLAAALPARSFVCDVPYFAIPWWTSASDEAATILTKALATSSAIVVPLHEAMRRQGRRALITQHAADLFHPNDRGYRVWASAFWERLLPAVPAVVASRPDRDGSRARPPEPGR